MTTIDPATAFDPATATAGALADALGRGELSATEAVEGAIARIEAGDGRLNAVVVRDFERARADARAADAALARGDQRPLLGVPMTVKESFDLAGHPTTWGFENFRGHVAAEDALAVKRLKAAGAIILGKTNVPVSLGDWQSANPIYGRTNNPLDVSRTPGGSSGGAAAAVAAGFVPLELGSDIGGSVRVPAAFCGVYGHKPSWGLLPMRGHSPGGFAGAEPPLAVIGPLARSIADLITVVEVLGWPDPGLTRAPGAPPPPSRVRSLEDARVLVLDRHPITRTSRAVAAAVNATADRLANAGAKVERGDDRVPDLASAHTTYIRMLNTVITQGEPHARPIDAHAWLFALAEQDRVRRAWAALFADWDVVLAPSFGTVAYPHIDGDDWSARTLDIDGEATPYGEQLGWPAVATFPHLPATGIPAGEADGMPIGVQLIGPYLEDMTPLRLAQLLSA